MAETRKWIPDALLAERILRDRSVFVWNAATSQFVQIRICAQSNWGPVGPGRLSWLLNHCRPLTKWIGAFYHESSGAVAFAPQFTRTYDGWNWVDGPVI